MGETDSYNYSRFDDYVAGAATWRMKRHLLRNGPRAAAEFEKARELWARRPATNRGCIPSKMLVHTADVAQTVRHADRFGIAAKWAGADWPAIRDRVFGPIDPLHEQAVAHRRANGIADLASG